VLPSLPGARGRVAPGQLIRPAASTNFGFDPVIHITPAACCPTSPWPPSSRSPCAETASSPAARARGRQHAGRLRSSTTGGGAAGARHAVGDARHGSHRDHRSGTRSCRMRGDEGRRDPAAAAGADGDVRAVGRRVVLPVGADRCLLPGRRRDSSSSTATSATRARRGGAMNACASRGRSRWPALVPADLYLDARRPEWAVYEACGRIRFQHMGRYAELPRVRIGAKWSRCWARSGRLRA